MMARLQRSPILYICVGASFLVLSISAQQDKNVPPLEVRCSRNDPKVNECLNNAIQNAVRFFKDGFEPLGMPKLDPLKVGRASLFCRQGNKLELINYDVMGLRNVICQNSSLTWSGENKFTLFFDMYMDQFDAVGTYEMEKSFLGSPEQNEGSFKFSLAGYFSNFVLDGVIETKGDGEQYITLSGVSASFSSGARLESHFSNLNKESNKLWNEQPAALLEAYKKSIDAVHPLMAAGYGNLLLQKVPCSYLFPQK